MGKIGGLTVPRRLWATREPAGQNGLAHLVLSGGLLDQVLLRIDLPNAQSGKRVDRACP